jgi:hypothetical protein
MHTEAPEIKAGSLIWLPLDLIVIVNNAGVATKSYETTPAGFEVAMGVKYLSPEPTELRTLMSKPVISLISY